MHSISNNIESNFKILNLRPFEPFETETSLAQQNTHQQRKLPQFDIKGKTRLKVFNPYPHDEIAITTIGNSPKKNSYYFFRF